MLVKVRDDLYLIPEEVSKVLLVNDALSASDSRTIIFMKDGAKHYVSVPEGITKYENLDRVVNIINEGLQ